MPTNKAIKKSKDKASKDKLGAKSFKVIASALKHKLAKAKAKAKA